MPIKVICVIVICFLSLKSKAQDAQGTFTISLGHGFANLSNYGFKKTIEKGQDLGNFDDIADLSQFSADYTGLGPYYAKGEYRISEKSSLGLNVANVVNNVRFNDDLNGYFYRLFRKNASFLLRYNYYLVAKEKFEFFTGVGIGLRIGSWGLETNNLNAGKFSVPFAIPLGFEATFGIRYFPVDFLSIYSEIGASKGLAQLGIAFRI